MEAIKGCSNLELVYNLNQCTAIGNEDGAFMGCAKLRNTSIENCNEVPHAAFDSCSSLTSIKLKPSAAVGTYAFYNCTNLSKVYNLNTVQSIGSWAFMSCSSLDQTIDLQRLSFGNLGCDAFIGAGARPFHVKLGSLTSDTVISNYFDPSNIKYVTIPPS